MHIYAKQYEIMQKQLVKKFKRQNWLFLQCKISSVVLKTWKTRENENYSKFSNTISYPGGYHVKADVLSYPKMWYFLGLTVFKVELLTAEVGSKFNKKNDGKVVSKKDTATIFGIFTNPRVTSKKYIFLGRGDS